MWQVGFIGWRGLVGQVLCDRIGETQDASNFVATLFSTSQAGEKAPTRFPHQHYDRLLDAYDVEALKKMQILVSTYGNSYTEKMYPRLRSAGWNGYWLDTASTLRLNKESTLVLDPINQKALEEAFRLGCKTFVGSNCTVALLLMALASWIRRDWIEWINTATYQAISGAGAGLLQQFMQEMVVGCHAIAGERPDLLAQLTSLEKTLKRSPDRTPIFGNAIPWIDRAVGFGQSREEWKGSTEATKLLGWSTPFPLDSLCVRVGTLRAHAQVCTIQLKAHYPLDILTEVLLENPWVEVVPNSSEESCSLLTPAAVSGSLMIRVGRLRWSTVGRHLLSLFTVGDQLLWGAAEPIRRVLAQLVQKNLTTLS